MDRKETLRKASEHVLAATSLRPRIGLVLGSGLGGFADSLEGSTSLPYAEIPGMPTVSIAGHAGRLVVGNVHGVSVACLQGRVHLYEGHGTDIATFGVQLLASMGCNVVLLTNAAGGINATYSPGDLMLISDHLNLTGRNPLVGPNDPELGPRFPDMTAAYDRGLRELANTAARTSGITLREGVYAGLLGPTYETPAEVRMLRTLGADAVGMSTVLEVIALRHRGVRVGAVSCITNLAAGISATPLDHAEVEAVGKASRERFISLFSSWISAIGKEASTS
ncbi:MAG: purine-nucleoside phosphorylase [Polyangiaceae bacterium]